MYIKIGRLKLRRYSTPSSESGHEHVPLCKNLIIYNNSRTYFEPPLFTNGEKKRGPQFRSIDDGLKDKQLFRDIFRFTLNFHEDNNNNRVYGERSA